MNKQNLFNFTPNSLLNILVDEFKCKPFVAKQLCQWIYEKGIFDFESMTNLSKELRSKLKDRFYMSLPEVRYKLKSSDGKTIKLKLGLDDDREVESVFMREDKHATICLSSQVGCAQACVFCATGKMGIIRNLQAGEIVAQYLLFRQLLGDKFPNSVRLVFMGMGEPFHNMNQVFKALEIFTHKQGLNIGSRKITVSTSGVTKGIRKLAEEMPQIQLAISLHTTDQPLRYQWVPNQKESVKDILKAARDFQSVSNRKITFEMVLFGGKQMQTARLNKLGKSLQDIRCNLNAIPYNPIPEGPEDFTRPTYEEIEHFKGIMSHWNKEVTVRISRGRDIQAACGQLIISK